MDLVLVVLVDEEGGEGLGVAQALQHAVDGYVVKEPTLPMTEGRSSRIGIRLADWERKRSKRGLEKCRKKGLPVHEARVAEVLQPDGPRGRGAAPLVTVPKIVATAPAAIAVAAVAVTVGAVGDLAAVAAVVAVADPAVPSAAAGAAVRGGGALAVGVEARVGG